MQCCFKAALGSEDYYHNLHDDQSSPSRRRNRTLKLLNGSVEESAGIQAGAVEAPLVCNTNVYKYNLVCNANNPTCAVVFTNVTLHWCTPLHTKTYPLVCNKYYALYTLVCNSNCNVYKYSLVCNTTLYITFCLSFHFAVLAIAQSKVFQDPDLAINAPSLESFVCL